MNCRKNLTPSNNPPFYISGAPAISGVEENNILFRQMPMESDVFGKAAGGMCSGGQDCIVTASLAEMQFRPWDSLDVDTEQAALVELAALCGQWTTNSDDVDVADFRYLYAAVVNIIMQICCPVTFEGISETNLLTASLPRTDTGITSVVDGTVSLVCDGDIQPGAIVGLEYPYENFNVKAFYETYVKHMTFGNDLKTRMQEHMSRHLKALTDASFSRSIMGMRLVSMETVSTCTKAKGAFAKHAKISRHDTPELAKYCKQTLMAIPIGQAVSGSACAGQTVHILLYAHLRVR